MVSIGLRGRRSRALRLIPFKYVRGRRILALALIIVFSSMLFSLTAQSLLGFYRGFTSYLGEGKDILAVYDRRSSTPFTGLVPAYLTENISALSGVLGASAEAIAPSLVQGEPVFLRGVIPGDFVRLTNLTMTKGEMLGLNDLSSVIAGVNVASRLHLGVNDKVLVLGVLSSRYLELQVKGIFVSHSAMDDEILAPLYVGQWLRGTDYAHVTLIRVRIDPKVITPSAILDVIAKEASEQGPASGQGPQPPSTTPGTIASFRVQDIGVEQAYNLMSSYTSRYGITTRSLLVLSAMVLLLAGASMAMASETVLAQHKGEVGILRSIGASRRLLKGDLITKLLPWSVAASGLGYAASVAVLALIQRGGYLRILSHTIPLELDPVIIALNFILVLSLVSISVMRLRVKP